MTPLARGWKQHVLDCRPHLINLVHEQKRRTLGRRRRLVCRQELSEQQELLRPLVRACLQHIDAAGARVGHVVALLDLVPTVKQFLRRNPFPARDAVLVEVASLRERVDERRLTAAADALDQKRLVAE